MEVIGVFQRVLKDTTGQVSITTNSAAPTSSAMLDIVSTDKGILIPRMDSTQRNAIASPATGLMIFNTNTNQFNYYNGAVWISLNIGNGTITGATKTKVTYDSKGLVTAGADATTADIAASTDKNYVTDAQLTVIGNTSGTNTGDNATNSQYSGLAASVGGKVDTNTSITGATKTKVTYDSKGLVTAGTDATTADIAASTDKNYVTDAQLTVIGNTSGTNTGDQDLSSLATKTALSDSTAQVRSEISAAAGWGLTGNASTVDGTNFIGTTDDVPFILKAGNQKAGRIETESFAGNNKSNTFFGYKSGNDITTGNRNTGFGLKALTAITTGAYNTATGIYSLTSTTTGNANTSTGDYSMFSNISGSNNAAVGNNALAGNQEGSANTAIGNAALGSNIAGSNATAIGAAAMQNANNQAGAYDNWNVAVGASALMGSGDPSVNTGNYNTSTGSESMFSNSTGNENTANGYQALYTNTAGSYNTALGSVALKSNLTGSSNIAMGTSSLFANTTGGNNIASGVQSLIQNTTGSNNTAIGDATLLLNTTGSNNTALGSGAGVGANNLENATAVGFGANVDASNKVQIGNGSVNAVMLGTGTNVTLETGLIKLTGGTPGTGKVLTSDGDGIGRWETDIAGNAATVTTNANLTGPVTSTGNATAIANGAITNAMLANSAVANLSGTNTGDQNLSAFATTSAMNTALADKVDKVTGKALLTNGTTTGQMNYWNGSAWVTVAAGTSGQTLTYCNGVPTWTTGGICPINIGDSYQGGIVAYLLQSGDPGYDAGTQHGLIAMASDQSTGAEWGCVFTPIRTL